MLSLLSHHKYQGRGICSQKRGLSLPPTSRCDGAYKFNNTSPIIIIEKTSTETRGTEGATEISSTSQRLCIWTHLLRSHCFSFLERPSIPPWSHSASFRYPSCNRTSGREQVHHQDSAKQRKWFLFFILVTIYTGKFVYVEAPQYLIAAKS